MFITDSKRYCDSLERAIKTTPILSKLKGKTILISGSTGMIGSCLIDILMKWNQMNNAGCHVYALTRNYDSAEKRFGYCKESGYLHFVEGDVTKGMHGAPELVDFIIHAASNADPVRMSLQPVETLLSNIVGTKNLIEYGMAHKMERFLYISSGEMYGQPNDRFDDFVEDYCGPIDYSQPRSCYPSGKRATEVLCQSYISEYNVDAVIVRPCHVYGPTMKLDDSRALSEFFKKAVYGESIELKSAGLLERSHCYSIDVAIAILYVLINGDCGQAYNIANKNNQMRIREFAQKISEISGVDIVYANPKDVESKGYSTSARMVLSEEKLMSLGWCPVHPGCEAIEETYQVLRDLHR